MVNHTSLLGAAVLTGALTVGAKWVPVASARREVVQMRAVLLGCLGVLSPLVGAQAQEVSISAGPTLYPDTALVTAGQPACAVVASSNSPAAAGAAQALRDGLRAAYALDFPIPADDQVCPARLGPLVESWRARNLIVVGNLDTNRVIFPLYATYLCGADSHYPGGDGHELRTVSNPWGTGANVIVVGGSSPAGMMAGVEELLRRLPERVGDGAVLARLHVIEPDGALAVQLRSTADALARVAAPSAQYDISTFWVAAQNYHWTGDERWAVRARDLLRFFNEHFAEGKYAVSDYTVDRVFRAWDVLEESPVLSAEDRLATLRNLVATALVMRRYAEGGNTRSVGSTHATVPRLAFWQIADYLRRTLPENGALMAIAKRWRAALQTYFNGVTQGFQNDTDWRAASVDDFVRWCAMAQQYGYFDSGNARAALLWALNENDTLGYHCGSGTYGSARTGAMYRGFSNVVMLQIGAFVYDDPELRFLARHAPNRDLSIYAQGTPPFGTGAFTPDPVAPEIEPVLPLGLSLNPISERRYTWVLSPRGSIPPLAETFNKACFRSGYDTHDQYLLVQGVHCERTRNANTIVRYTDRGQVWLVSNSSQQGQYHYNGLAISDGANQGQVAVACRLDTAARFDGCGMLASTFADYHGTDWQRGVFWRPGEWFAVLDRARVLRAGRYAAQSVWRLPVRGQWRDGRELVAIQEDAALHIITDAPVAVSAAFEPPAGGPPDIYENPFFLRQRRGGSYEPGQVVGFGNLLVTTDADAVSPHQPLRVSDSAMLVRSPGDAWTLVGLGGERCEALGLQADAGMFMLDARALHLAGVRRLLLDGAEVLGSEQPLTARVDLASGAMTSGWDGAQLQAAALTWKLPAQERGGNLDPAVAAALWRTISARVRGLRSDGGEMGVVPGQGHPTGAVETLWRTDPLAPHGRPVEGLNITIPNEHNGRSGSLLDGLLPFRSGAVGWPTDATATLELRWDRPEPVAELRLWMFTLGRRNDMSLARRLDEARQVTLTWSSDGFREDLRSTEVTVQAGYRSFPGYKGTCEAQKVLVIPAEGTVASGVRVSLGPGPTDWRGSTVALSEVEVLAPEQGPVETHQLLQVDLQRDGRVGWLVSVGEGTLALVGEDGVVRWRQDFAGEVSSIDTGDLDGDGIDEVLCGSYDMYLTALSADGSVRWRSDFTALRSERPDQFTQKQPPDAGPIPFGVGFWEPLVGVPRVVVGGYESTTCVFAGAGRLLQVIYPGFSMFQRTFIPGSVDINGDGVRDKLMCSMKYGAYGVLHVLTGGSDGLISGFRNTALPDNLPWVAHLVGAARRQAVVITPVGFGLYDMTVNFPEQTQRMGDPNGVWEVRGGRALSAGLVADVTGDGVEEVLVGGRDGFLSVFSLQGEALRVELVGEPVTGLATVKSGGDRRVVVGTDQRLIVYDAQWREVGGLDTPCPRLTAVDAQHSTVLAATPDGRLTLLRLR